MKKKIIIILVLLTFKAEAQSSVLKIADSIFQTGDYQLALQQLENSKEQSIIVFERMANIYQKVGNYNKAIQFFEKASQLKPSDRNKEQLGRSYQSSGNVDKAIAIYNEVLKSSTNNTLLQFQLAKLYLSEGKIKKAIDLFEKLSKKDSLNPNYPYQLGVAYKKLGHSGVFDSGNSFLKAYTIDSLHLKSIYNLVKFYRELNFKDSTQFFIDRGLKINPKSKSFNQLKVKDAFLNTAYDTALVYLKKLEKLNVKTMFTYKMYGLTYLNMKNYKKAEEYFKIAQKKDFGDASVAYNLGLVYKHLGDFKKAEYYLKKSIYHQKPKVDKNYYQLGMVQLKQKDLKKALHSFNEGYKNNRRNYILLFQMALIEDEYYKAKKIALAHYEKYIEDFPDKDKQSTLYAKKRIKEIKKELFIKGEKID